MESPSEAVEGPSVQFLHGFRRTLQGYRKTGHQVAQSKATGVLFLEDEFCFVFWNGHGIYYQRDTRLLLKESIHKKNNFHGRWAMLRQVQGHLNCLLRPPPSPALDQNIKRYKAPTPGLESATWGIVNRLHSAPVETIYNPPSGTFQSRGRSPISFDVLVYSW